MSQVRAYAQSAQRVRNTLAIKGPASEMEGNHTKLTDRHSSLYRDSKYWSSWFVQTQCSSSIRTWPRATVLAVLVSLRGFIAMLAGYGS
ncbi:hypothetical protein PAXRUDRAFT_821048 [Paxillus rubicundulus Ve08.2h10]|uniref:Uncharacterized protein n=1 Tax=Paxillus rubicundulus Ve08.2h10 TaxID=930991 RepID=A0A0D0DYT8_9AGAM|nr:hypothetical protein PAXRUDRAFT_821048 [Paxillus rubicundulus Ve08.2h10]